LNSVSTIKFNSDEQIKPEDWFSTNFDQWYSELKDYTIKSEFISMTETQIKDFVNVMKEKTEFPESIQRKKKFNQFNQTKELQKQIDEKIEIFSDAFVKLSCRSPKDVTVNCEKLVKLYKQEIEKINQPTDNDKGLYFHFLI
jgi:replicative DNA helicase